MRRAEPSSASAFNLKAAGLFRQFATLLRQQKANPFRVNAYLHAASTLESCEKDAREILRADGIEGLMRLPTIGFGLASSIEEIARSGKLSQLDRLKGSADPAHLFRSVPGIGGVLSRRLFDTLHVDTLEALELAAHDGRLASVPGIGPRRVEGIKAGIARLLQTRRGIRGATRAAPPVQLLLDVDAEYRDKAAHDGLPRLAPRRFNPTQEAWLPVYHTERAPWHFTALFSNTALAHELDRTRDWVVIYYYDDDHREGQCTVVTETQGALRGRRVIRGRENECREAHEPVAPMT